MSVITKINPLSSSPASTDAFHYMPAGGYHTVRCTVIDAGRLLE